MFGFRILVLLFLVGWVRNHLGGGTIATVVMLVVGYLLLFQFWEVYGFLVFIYLIIIVGFANVVMDIAFGRREYLGIEEEAPEMYRARLG